MNNYCSTCGNRTRLINLSFRPLLGYHHIVHNACWFHALFYYFGIKADFKFIWFDFWIGLFYNTENKKLYFCPLPYR